MSDGGDNLSDITGEASGNEIRAVEQVPTVHSAEAASGTTGENTEAAADSEGKKESVPVKEKLLHAASAAGTAASAAANKSVEVATKVTVEVSSAASAAAVKSAEIAVKVTGEVVEAVGKVSHKVVETAGTAVRRFTQTGASAEPGAEEGQPAQNSEPENDSKSQLSVLQKVLPRQKQFQRALNLAKAPPLQRLSKPKKSHQCGIKCGGFPELLFYRRSQPLVLPTKLQSPLRTRPVIQLRMSPPKLQTARSRRMKPVSRLPKPPQLALQKGRPLCGAKPRTVPFMSWIA